MPETPATQKTFPVSWDQLHRDSRALAWRLIEGGPWQGIAAITRGGMVPAAIIARELEVRLIDTVCIASYDERKQGGSIHLLQGGKVALSDRARLESIAEGSCGAGIGAGAWRCRRATAA